MVTMPDCRSVWYGFESRIDRNLNIGVYQLVDFGIWDAEAAGSSPVTYTSQPWQEISDAPVAQLVVANDC